MIHFPEYCYETEGRFYTPYYHLGQWGFSVGLKGQIRPITLWAESIENVGKKCNISSEDILVLKLTYGK